jgi:serine protease inhibitor ecotin
MWRPDFQGQFKNRAPYMTSACGFVEQVIAPDPNDASKTQRHQILYLGQNTRTNTLTGSRFQEFVPDAMTGPHLANMLALIDHGMNN